MDKTDKLHEFKLIVRNFIVPTIPAAILYVLLSINILFFTNIKQILTLIGNQVDEVQYISVNTDFTRSINTFLSNPIFAAMSSFVLWSFIGGISYMIIWFSQNIFGNVVREVDEDINYVHPRGYNRKKYWQSVFAQYVLFIWSLIVTITDVILSIFIILPYCSQLVMGMFIQGLNPRTAISVLFAIVVVALSIHLLVIFFRLSVNIWRELVHG